MLKVLLLCSLTAVSVSAVDLGVKAKVFDVIEIDIRIYFIKKMAENLDIEQHKKQLEEAANRYYRTLPRKQLMLSEKAEVKYVDPTRVYESDFWGAQKKPDETFEWVKVVEAGQEVNWLEHSPTPMPIYFIFDSASKPQLDFARELAKVDIPFLSFVFIGGDITSASEFVGRPVTYLNEAMIREYDIQFVPSMVKRGAGDKRNFYHVERFKFDEMRVDEFVRILRD